MNNVADVTAALRTITPDQKDFQQLSIHLPLIFRNPGFIPVDLRLVIGGEAYLQWKALDSAIVRLCESHAIRVKVVCHMLNGGEVTSKHLECLLLHTMTASKQGRVELQVSAWDETRYPTLHVLPGSWNILVSH